jgi:hypothetical protein
MTRRRKLPVGRWLQPCPDCAATFVGRELEHEDTCPLAAGVDAICDEDRRWFLDHPGEWTRTRPISAAEMATLAHLDAVTPTDRPTHVHVLNAPWGRVRTFCDHNEFSGVVLDTDDEAAS